MNGTTGASFIAASDFRGFAAAFVSPPCHVRRGRLLRSDLAVAAVHELRLVLARDIRSGTTAQAATVDERLARPRRRKAER
jgi:hypothetical protein